MKAVPAGRVGGGGAAGRPQRLAYRAQRAPQAPPAVRAEEGAAAKALLDRVIAAKGGLDTLRAVKMLTVVTLSDLPSPNGVVAAKATTLLAYPDRVRVETELPDAKIIQAFDGTRAWIKDPRGVHDVPEQAVEDLRLSLRRDTIAVLLAAHDGDVRTRLLPDVKDARGRRYRALELSGTSLEPMVLSIDPDTGLIAKQTYVTGGVGQPLIEELFSDYKTIDGVQIAFGATVQRGGTKVLERRVQDIRINAPIDPALFKRPAS
jgi:hypothetical protein